MAGRKLVAGNWKMNGSLAALAELDAIRRAADETTSAIEVAVALPFTLLAAAASRIGTGLAIGAQDVHPLDQGAHTGSVSAAMIAEAGARFAIVGHSERRADCHETDALVRAKAQALHRRGLGAILCVGETLAQREGGRAETVVEDQLAGSVPEAADGSWLSIAYEPVWAIGTGLTPTLDDVGLMHRTIRAALGRRLGGGAGGVRILYGGSVTGDNAADLLAIDQVDGALVGGASLTAAKFCPIIAAAR